MNAIRLNIYDRRNNKHKECMFSQELNLYENLSLYNDLYNYSKELHYVFIKETNRALDLSKALKDYKFVDGQILYLY